MPAMLEQITLQPRIRDLLISMVEANRATHAYLFSGPKGAGKLDMACAFAQALVCADQGCGRCIDCKKALLRNHPDIQIITPKGTQGYLIEQIREVVTSATRAPIQAQRKVFILEDVEQLGTSAANAFLKTLEEPSPRVTLILLTSHQDSVLPTILSRCQVVSFPAIPEANLIAEVVQKTQCAPDIARIAVNVCAGSLELTEAFCTSDDLQQMRRNVLDALEALQESDDWDTLKLSAGLATGGESLIEELQAQQEEELTVADDFLSKGARKQLEDAHKRAITAKKRQLFHLRCSIMESWLRDILLLRTGCASIMVNTDAAEGLRQAAKATSEAGVLCACAAVSRAKAAMDYNVSLQLCLDALLLDIREDLYGPHNTR